MPMINKCWGSECLTGADSLSNRMPLITGFHRPLDIAQSVEQQTHNL